MFLFPSQFHSKRCSLLLTMKSDFSHQISENMKSYFRNKQEHKVSYRCSLPSPLQKGSMDWEVTSLLFGHDKSILNWCRCNLVVSWVLNRILQRDFKIFIRIRVNGSSKEFVKVHRISHLWINRIRTSQSLDPFCNGDGNEHL